MGVNDEFCESQDLPTQVEGVAKPRLLPLLGGECLDWLQVEVVVEVEVVEVLAMDEEVEHVVALSAHLEPRLHPVQLGRLKELCRLERSEEVPRDRGRSKGGRRDCYQFRSTLTSFSGLWEACA